MEVLLNLAWLLVATGAIVLWLRQRGRTASTGRRGVLLQSVALACALAVLFPAISATDDLHAAQLAVEASDVARKALSMNTVSSSNAVDWLHFLPALLLLAVMTAPQRRYIHSVRSFFVSTHDASLLSFLISRAPPVQLSA